MSTISNLMMAEELERLPSDGIPRELRRGELIEMSPAGFDHGRIAAKIAIRLGTFVDNHQLGEVVGAETGFILEEHPDTVLAPDVAYISQDRLSNLDLSRSYAKGAPDLVVEVISPSDTVKGVMTKAQEWLSFGTLQAWVVNPRDRSLTILETGSKPKSFQHPETIEFETILPGFRLSLVDVFATRRKN